MKIALYCPLLLITLLDNGTCQIRNSISFFQDTVVHFDRRLSQLQYYCGEQFVCSVPVNIDFDSRPNLIINSLRYVRIFTDSTIYFFSKAADKHSDTVRRRKLTDYEKKRNSRNILVSP